MLKTTQFIYIFILSILITSSNLLALGPASYVSNVNAATLASKIQGEGLTITNPVLTRGCSNQVGTFTNGSNANLQIDEGILLTSSTVDEAFVKNHEGNTSKNPGNCVLNSSYNNNDSDLRTTIQKNFPLSNQVTFEFDITLAQDVEKILVDYQFASEEYPEWVGSVYNDAFGFFISGPGLKSTINIARASENLTVTEANVDKFDPINVNNINIGERGNAYYKDEASDFIGTHSSLFIDNGGTNSTNKNLGGIDLSKVVIYSTFDGFTKKLHASLSQLQGDKKYHFKMAIADTSDFQWDGGVFINKIRGVLALPKISISDVNLTEGDSGTKDFTFTVNLDHTSSRVVTVDYKTNDDSAKVTDSDYIALNTQTLSFAIGETSKTITVKVNGDTKVEPDEIFNVILSNPSNATIDKDTGVGTIIDDDKGSPTSEITFNIERTNSYLDTINTDERNALYTQVTGRIFNYDVVAYKPDGELFDSEKALSQNIVMQINLLNAKKEIIDTRYAYFEINDIRSHVTEVKLTVADKNSIFLGNLLTSNGYLIKAHCSVPSETLKECYFRTWNENEANGVVVSTFESIDNFAIRPAGYSYTITGLGSTTAPLIDNSALNDNTIHLAAKEEYAFEAKALRYDDNDSNIEGYNNIPVQRGMTFRGSKSCDDKEDRNDTIKFTSGVMHDTNFDINQTGIYTLSLLDENWTKVDKDKGDCVDNNYNISDVENDKQGCNIASEITLNGVDYSDQTITVYPYKFSVDLEDSSNPSNLEAIYMHTITATNATMSKQVNVTITAQSKKDTNLTNFTDGCMAKDLTLDINITSQSGLTLIQDTNGQKRNLYLLAENNGLTKVENNSTNFGNGIPKSEFVQADKGIAKIKLNYNIDRNNTAPVNPEDINLTSLEVTSPNAYYNTTQNSQTIPKGVSTTVINDTFLYARTRASQKLYEGSRDIGTVNSTLAIDVYCLDPLNINTCLNAAGNPRYGLPTSETPLGWWLAFRNINANQAGTVALQNSLNGNINPQQNIQIPNNPNLNGPAGNINAIHTNIQINCPARENQIADISIDINNNNAPWLVYHNNPLFRIKCSDGSNWAGVGSEGNVLNGAIQRGAAAINPNNPPAIPDASGIRNTHKMSW